MPFEGRDDIEFEQDAAGGVEGGGAAATEQESEMRWFNSKRLHSSKTEKQSVQKLPYLFVRALQPHVGIPKFDGSSAHTSLVDAYVGVIRIEGLVHIPAEDCIAHCREDFSLAPPRVRSSPLNTTTPTGTVLYLRRA